jgi:hypothetical protein
VSDGTEAITREYERLKKMRSLKRTTSNPRAANVNPGSNLTKEVQAIVAALDTHGRWVEEGRLKYHGSEDPTRRVIRSATFVRNLETLSRFLSTPDP